MNALRKRAAIPFGLAVMSFALALAQSPGHASSDTKIDLHLDPGAFLGAAAAPWTDAYGLGAVWSGQYSGYLWPMGPFFALGHGAGLPAWLVQRLWLGLVLALAAYGVVKLVDALHDERRGVAHLVAGLAFVANPYVVVFANRTSITLLAYAALPWLLFATHRGLRHARGWWWPAAFALILASAGGGVNAATTAWVLVAPALLAVYEVGVIGVGWRNLRAFAVRTVPLTVLASAWWLVPTVVQVLYGIDFLRFTEQPSVIWHTTSLTESLRGMGYWTAYTELGFGGVRVPYFSDAGTLLFNPLTVVASLLLPALAFGSLALARRRPYAPLMAWMALFGAFVMMAGFPEASPLRRAITALYVELAPLQFLRTTYKAGPLVLLGLALLLGLGAEHIWRKARTTHRLALGGAGALLLVLAALPLFLGRAVDRDVEFKLPDAYRQAAADVDRDLPTNTRALVLPGSLYGFQDWGATTDPALPALTDRPTAARFAVPYSDLRAIDLLWTVDGLVEEGRTVHGQLAPLLDRMGVGQVLSPTDYDARRAGSVPPADAARALAEGGLSHATRSYGPSTTAAAASSSLAPTLRLPRLRRFDTPTTGGGLVRLRPRSRPTVLDGSAGGVVNLAAFGALDRRRALLYAADQTPDQLRHLAATGADIVISDSNRRRAYVNSRIRANTGRTLDAGDEIPPDVAVLDPFDRGPDDETVAVYGGARYVRGTIEASFSQFPERGPAAAFDGNPRTQWLTNAFLRPGERPFLEVGFDRPRDVGSIELVPYGDNRGRPTEVEIDGRRFKLHRGNNRLRLGLRHVSKLRLLITDSAAPPRGGGPGGISELRVPGLHVRERLRMPLTVDHALRGQPLDHARLTVLAERTTAYSPLRLSPAAGPLQARDLRNRADPEPAMHRTVDLPATRRFEVDAWTSAGGATGGPTLDRLAGYDGPVRLASSPLFESIPGRRASSAFDGVSKTAWIAAWTPDRPATLSWRTPRARRLTRLRLADSPTGVRVPTRVRLRWAGGETAPLAPSADGTLRLAHPVSARAFSLEILDAELPAGADPAAHRRRAVGIGELHGPGVPHVVIPRRGRLHARCSDASVTVGGQRVGIRPSGSVASLDAGRPLRAQGCTSVRLPAGTTEIDGAIGPLRTDLLRLDSAASAPLAAAPGGGRVLDSGRLGHGRLDGARIAPTGPSWLVLGEAYSKGWRARCDGRDLGSPVPIDGYANGWPVRRCGTVSFAFAANAPTRVSYAISLVAALLLLLLLLLRRPLAFTSAAPPPANRDRAARRSLIYATSVGALAAIVLGLAFALRAGVVAGPLVGLVVWRGLGARTLAAISAGLLGLVVPVIYLVAMPDDLGGFNSNYPLDLLDAHWVGVLAAVTAGLAAWRATAAVRAAQGAP